MMHPYPISRKLIHAVRGGIDRLKGDDFDERDVKALMLDLRELARYMHERLKAGGEDEAIRIQEFLDICDFLAHSIRDRGLIESAIRDHLRNLHMQINTAPMESVLPIPTERIINANSLVLGLAGVAYLCLRSEDKSFDQSSLHPLLAHQSDIALCILSVLQDTIVTLKHDEGFAMLQLFPYEGYVRLYCRVLNSRMEREARARTGGTGRVVLGFPVMSSAKRLEGMVLEVDPAEIPGPVFETYRNHDKSLCLRRIS